MTLHTETEEKIIISAEKLFYQKGKAGASMQDIADDAGINRPLLNYYFRSKDKLFEAVFRKALGSFVPSLAVMLHSDISFEEYVPKMIHVIIDNMIANPQIPVFVLQELSSNPERMPQIVKEMGIDQKVFEEKMYEKMDTKPDGSKKLKSDFRQMVINLISLCIFPFAARPVITGILFNGDDEAFIKAMNERKEVLPGMFQKLISQNQ